MPTRCKAAGRVIGHERTETLAEGFGEITDLVKDRGVDGIEWWRVGEQCFSFRFGMLIHPIPVAFGAQDHQQRSLGSDCLVQGIDHSLGAACNGADGSQGGVNHQHVARPHAQAAEIVGDRP